MDRHNTITSINVEFQKKNFLHLTGLDYKQRQQLKRSGSISEMKIATNAEEFYERLGTDSSLISDVSFIQGQTQAETDLYYKYTQYKLHNLSQITSIASKACYIGKYKGTQNFDVIVNKSLSSLALLKLNDKFLPVSSLSGKPEVLATDVRKILAIFSREEEQDFKLNYLNADINIGNKLFSEETLSLLKPTSFINLDVKFNQSQLHALVHSFEVSTQKLIKSQIEDIFWETEKMDIDLIVIGMKIEKLMNSLNTDFKLNSAKTYLNEKGYCNEITLEMTRYIDSALNGNHHPYTFAGSILEEELEDEDEWEI